MALSIDIARDLTFLMYFFASALIGHSIARYMPLEYLVYGLFLAGSYVTLLVLIKLILGFQGDFSLLAIREITGGAGDFGIIFIALSFYGIRYFPIFLAFVGSLFLMFLTQSRTMLLSFLVWIYFMFTNNSTIFFKWLIRLFAIFLFASLVIFGASADSESYTFLVSF